MNQSEVAPTESSSEMMCMDWCCDNMTVWRFVPGIGMLSLAKKKQDSSRKIQKIHANSPKFSNPTKKTQILKITTVELEVHFWGAHTRAYFSTLSLVNPFFLLAFCSNFWEFNSLTILAFTKATRTSSCFSSFSGLCLGNHGLFLMRKFWDGFNVWEFSWFMRLLFSKSIQDNFKQFLEDSEYFDLFLFLFFHLKLDSSWLDNYLSHSKIGLRCLE